MIPANPSAVFRRLAYRPFHAVEKVAAPTVNFFLIPQGIA
jgi:hypothetical protein